MQPPKMIFSQLMDWIHPQTFRRIVARHRGDYKVQSFSCWDQFLCQAFAQLTYRESLGDIEVCLRSRCGQLYRLGIRSAVSRSTLAHANEHRPWQMSVKNSAAATQSVMISPKVFPAGIIGNTCSE